MINMSNKANSHGHFALLRLKKSLTQTQTANLLGMKNLYSYQRLESSKHLNPSLTMLMRLKRIFPELKVDDILS